MATDGRTTADPSVSSLVGGIINDAQELIKQQFLLLRSEVLHELRQARTAAISITAGVAVAALGVILLTLMCVYLLETYTDIPLWGCYGIVGGAFVAAGVAFLYFGAREAGDVTLAPPPQTAEALRENTQWLRGQTTSERT